jgi:hypothetical protein
VKLHPVKIHIQNFQSIDDLEIEVHGFTCITGPSNVGKSAIVRATSSAILNNPVVGMVRKGAQFCTVEISSEGWGFKWEKNDKGVNRVWLPGKDKPLDKIGQVQVKEISQMGFGSIEVGDDEIQPWFAPQFQSKGCGPLFLLDQSGPRVTDFLSEVSRLTILQDAIVLAARGKRGATDQAKNKHEEAANLRTLLARIGALDTLEKLGRDLEEQASSIEQYEERITLGESLIAKRVEAERIIRILEKVDDVKIPKDVAAEPIQKFRDVYRICALLEKSAAKVRDVRDVSKVKVPDLLDEEIGKLRELQRFAQLEPLRQSVKLLEDLTKVKVPDSKKLRAEMEKLSTIAGYATKIEAARASVALLDQDVPTPEDIEEVKRLRQLLELDQRLQEAAADVMTLEAQVKQNDADLEKIDKAIAAIPACPTCHRPWSPEHTGRHKKLSA